MSPAGEQQAADAEELRRQMVSPGSIRSIKQNGVGHNVPNSLKGKQPMRGNQIDEIDEDSSPEVSSHDRAISPDQGRAKSPNTFSSNRAMSPISQLSSDHHGQPISMVAALGMNAPTNGITARSASPSVGKSSLDGSMYGLTKPASPIPNGFAHGKPGSTGNITADLIRDLKEKEAEVEALKKKEAWMRVALTKASRSGFVYAEGEDLGDNAEDDDVDGRKVAELVINLKHLKARLQVRQVFFSSTSFSLQGRQWLTLALVGHCRRAIEACFRAHRGS